MLAREKDIALVFLDVVMEREDSGLEVARWMRQDLDNQFTRIVLRTGQPGQAPEERVIVDYDINDYKEKTELDRTKLFTTTFAALRAYRDIMKVEEARRVQHELPRRPGARDRRLRPHFPAAQPERLRQRPAAAGRGPAAPGAEHAAARGRRQRHHRREPNTRCWPRSANAASDDICARTDRPAGRGAPQPHLQACTATPTSATSRTTAARRRCWC